jgi:WD40 repeat protein
MLSVEGFRGDEDNPTLLRTYEVASSCNLHHQGSHESRRQVRHLLRQFTRGRVLKPPTRRFLATCSADKAANLKIWSISLGQPQLEIRMEKMLQGHQRWVWDCAFSADSAYLVTGASSAFWTWR